MRQRLVTFFATGAYAGYSPAMPGTIGTLWGIGIAYFIAPWPLYGRALLTAAMFVGSVFLSGQAVGYFEKDDPSQIVIDEVSGFLIAFFYMPFTPLPVALVFILFRFFDIVKPFPINLIDKKMRGGLGITLDDAVAGVYASIAAHGVLWLTRYARL